MHALCGCFEMKRSVAAGERDAIHTCKLHVLSLVIVCHAQTRLVAGPL